jgi:NADH:ubiquinone oxidoreductase subunit 5 (subunit L)/multisubunit Na+/H+ antiporter MnhA subunit
MPIAFMGGLLGICGLIGVPLTNGFVSKWLIYKALIIGHYPFLAFAALVGTWGTILSVYKFLHNMFLGQLPEKHREVRRSPFSMQLPIIVLSLAILLFGILPGIPLSVIQSIQEAMGFEPLEVTLWGLASEAGALNMLNICFAVVIAFVAVFLLMRLGAKGPRVSQEDSYAAGSAVPVGKYHHTVDFYDPLYRMISPYLKDRVDEFYSWVGARARGVFDVTRRMYTGYAGTYVFYIVSFLALLIFVQLVWQVW